MRDWKDRNEPRGEADEKPAAARISRQKRQRMNEEQQYLAMRDIFLEQNRECVNCGKAPANQIHHVVRGANRQRSLLNPDTWLGVCSPECHEAIAALPIAVQVSIKQRSVKGTVERLRK